MCYLLSFSQFRNERVFNNLEVLLNVAQIFKDLKGEPFLRLCFWRFIINGDGRKFYKNNNHLRMDKDKTQTNIALEYLHKQEIDRSFL